MAVGFRRRDDQDVVGRQTEADDRAGDPGRRVDQDRIGLLLQAAQMLEQPMLLALADVRQTIQTRGAADDPQSLGAGLNNFLHPLMSANHMRDVVFAADVHHQVEIAQGQVRIQQEHALIRGGQADGQVGGDVGLADAAFAAGDGQHRGRRAAGLG